MNERTVRSTVYFEQALQEDQEDLAAFDERADEPTLSYGELLNDLKAQGRL